MKKKIIYWSPHLTHIGTINSILNSIKSLRSNSNFSLDLELVNLFGEWTNYQKFLREKKVNVINLHKPSINKYFPKIGFYKSRLTYICLFIISFMKLKKYLSKNNENILIIHLLTSLPLVVSWFFNIKIDIILRISGKVKQNFFRTLVWKLSKNKIKYITCPSEETRKDIINLNIFDKSKIITLYDPIIDPGKINKIKNEKLDEVFLNNKKYVLGIGRLTNQKNFSKLITSFKKISLKQKDLLLVILGNGEKHQELTNLINSLDLSEKVFLLGFKNNVYKYLSKAEVFISCSKYEDPGASIIQAVNLNIFVISSNCKNGPAEILLNGKGGILFDLKKNNLEDCYEKFMNLNLEEKKNMIKNAKKNIIKYTLFRHSQNLINIINSI